MKMILILLKIYCTICCVIIGLALAIEHSNDIKKQVDRRKANIKCPYDDLRMSIIGLIVAIGIFLSAIVVWF